MFFNYYLRVFIIKGTRNSKQSLMVDLVRIELTWFSVCKTDDHAMQSRSPKRNLFMYRWSCQPPAFKVRKPSTHSQGGIGAGERTRTFRLMILNHSPMPIRLHQQIKSFITHIAKIRTSSIVRTRTNFYSFGFQEPIALINVSIATISQ